MIYYNLTTIFIILTILLCASMVSMLSGKKGIVASFIINLLITGTVCVYSFFLEDLQISDLIALDKLKLQYIFIFSVINTGLLVFNGCRNIQSVGNSAINTIYLLVSFALLGAKDLIIFFLALIIPIVFSSILLFINEPFKKRALNITIANIFVLSTLLLGICFYYLSTGTMNLYDSSIDNPILYSVSLLLFFCVTCFYIGIFPFSLVVKDIINSKFNKYQTSHIIFTWSLIGFSLIDLLYRTMFFYKNMFNAPSILVIKVILIFAMIIPNIIALFKSSMKEILSYVFMAHTAYIMYVVYIPFKQEIGFQILQYFVFHGISFASVLIILSSLSVDGKNIQKAYEAKGLIIKHKIIGIYLLICLFSIIGIPLTSGAKSKYLIIIEYLNNGQDYVVWSILFSLLLGSINLIKTFFPFFMVEGESKYDVRIRPRYLFIVSIVVVLTILGGVIPVGFEEMIR